MILLIGCLIQVGMGLLTIVDSFELLHYLILHIIMGLCPRFCIYMESIQCHVAI